MATLNLIKLLESFEDYLELPQQFLLNHLIASLRKVAQDNSKIFAFMEEYELSKNYGELGEYLRSLSNEYREGIIAGILDPKYPYFIAVPEEFSELIYKSSWQVPSWRHAMIQYLAQLNLDPDEPF